MKTKEEIIKGLKTCTIFEMNCVNCPYFKLDECGEELMNDSLELIEALLDGKMVE